MCASHTDTQKADLPTLTVSGFLSQSHGLASKSHGFVALGSLTVRVIDKNVHTSYGVKD